jgi:hypothetical protein
MSDPKEQPLHVRMDLSLKALERLLGGDTTLEATLRQQVAEQFIKHHLKTIINDALFERLKKWAEEELKKVADEAIGVIKNDWYGQTRELTLSYYLKDRLQAAANKLADETIKDRLTKYKADLLARDATHIEKVVQRALDQDLEKRVQDELQRRLTLAKEIK